MSIKINKQIKWENLKLKKKCSELRFFTYIRKMASPHSFQISFPHLENGMDKTFNYAE